MKNLSSRELVLKVICLKTSSAAEDSPIVSVRFTVVKKLSETEVDNKIKYHDSHPGPPRHFGGT